MADVNSNLHTYPPFQTWLLFTHLVPKVQSTSTQSQLWHLTTVHILFCTINDLTKLDLVDGLPKFKYEKDHLCSACERGKSKKASHPSKLISSDYSKLELLHMDLCGPMRVASVNEKKYILVIVDIIKIHVGLFCIVRKTKLQRSSRNPLLKLN
ncbi:retrovirus-related pol polyprotein from transposon TNT 1-94 [Tanacetum coccineum]